MLLIVGFMIAPMIEFLIKLRSDKALTFGGPFLFKRYILKGPFLFKRYIFKRYILKRRWM